MCPAKSGDGAVDPLPPGMAPNGGASFERDLGGAKKRAIGQRAFSLLGDETTGAARSGVADRWRNECQGKDSAPRSGAKSDP